jgi:site-specific DNA-methyltransferase (adenine-specific)
MTIDRRLLLPQDVPTAAFAGTDDNPTLLVTADERYYVTETATGLRFRPDTPLAVWAGLTSRLIRAHKRLEFALADAINFGRDYGEKYAQWVHESGLSVQTLHDIAWVGRRIEPSRRREDISFAHHREVAALPPVMQDAILDIAEEKGWKREDVRRAAGEARAQIKANERAQLPPPTIVPSCQIAVGDARRMDLGDDMVDLIVTSPPYALGKRYLKGDIAVDQWRALMQDWLTEAYRYTKPGGRLALNVPLDTAPIAEDPATGQPYVPARPTYAQALTDAQRAGWTYRNTIVWHDDQLGKSTARGSRDSAASPFIYFPGEVIILLFKGDEWGQTRTDVSSDLSHEGWLIWTNGYWPVRGETNAVDGHPAPFPIEIPRRLIYLLSFPGDLVVDPFVGSGTTAEAAAVAGRRFYGTDTEESYVLSARRRVAERIAA